MTAKSVGELVLDFTIYPRSGINQQHVSNLVEALRTGATFPPVLIEQGTNRVVDGFHRASAIQRVFGDSGTVSVEEREYASEGELFLACMSANATHGQRLTPYDQAKCLVEGEKLGLSEVSIAQALQLTETRLGALRATKIATREGESIAIKHTARHLAGQPLTLKQAETMPKIAGMKCSFYARQLMAAIEGDLVDTSDRREIEKLWQLKAALDGLLAQIGEPVTA